VVGRLEVVVILLIRVGVVPVLWWLPGYQHILRLEASMPLFQCPHSDHHATTDPQDPGQLSQSLDTSLRGGEVVHHRQRQHRIETVVPKRQLQIVTKGNLERKIIMM